MLTRRREAPPTITQRKPEKIFKTRYKVYAGLGAAAIVYAQVPVFQESVDAIFLNAVGKATAEDVAPNACTPIVQYGESPSEPRPDYDQIAQVLGSNSTSGGNWFLVDCEHGLVRDDVEQVSPHAVIQVDGVPKDCVATHIAPGAKPEKDGAYPIVAAYCPADEEAQAIFSTAE